MTGTLVVVSGPSGVGKRTLIEHLCATVPRARLSVSATTRAPRQNEIEGTDYYFLSPQEFAQRIDKDEFLEHAEYAGNHYGTPRTEVERLLKAGAMIIVEIEVQGARQIKQKMPDARLIFIAPPTPEIPILRERLKARGTESAERIEARLAIAEGELTQVGFFDRIMVNDDLDTAKHTIASIVNIWR